MLFNKQIIFAGSALAVVASFGVATRAIALPEAEPNRQQTLQLAQDVDVSEEPQQVPATVIAVEPDEGYIRVDLEDGFDREVDTIYLGVEDIRSLELDVGEELIVVYQNEQAVGLIREGEYAALNPSGEAFEEPVAPQATTPDIYPDTTTPAPTRPAPAPTRPEVTQQPVQRQPVQQQPTYETQPQTTEPVQGLW